jgi:tight adherence protein B
MALLIAFITFVVATIACLLIWFSFTGSARHEIIQRRMQAVERAERRGSAETGVEILRDELMSGVPAFNRALVKWSWSRHFKDYVAQAGVKARPGEIVLTCAVFAAVGYLVADFAYDAFPVPLVAAAVGALLPLAYISRKRRRRLRRFEELFPDALDLLNRAIRAGHAFVTGLGMIAAESPEPVASEFRATFEEHNFGLPLRDALQNLTERIPLIDVRFFATALLIQKETGGNLSEILDNLAHVIRDRFRIYRDVRSKSAHGRLTAGILISLPPLMVLAFEAANPSYMPVLMNDRLGPLILAGATIWEVLGSLLLWKIVNIEV